MGCDVANAFGEAPKPERPFYMRIDAPFQTWWTEHKKRDPLPNDYVIPIEKNLQGHPEAPRQWNKYIDKILRNMKFQATTHEPCFYYGRRDNQAIYILRQVDDFLIAGNTLQLCGQVKAEIESYMTNKLHDLGIVIRFNGLDIQQTRHYVKIFNDTYITKIVEAHQ